MAQEVPASGEHAELASVLACIGETPGTVTTLVAGLDEDALRRAGSEAASCHALLQALIAASLDLGRVAHVVLGHVPGAGDGILTAADGMTGAELLRWLCYLREHIVSTVAQQGAAVWFTRTAEDRPLLAYAADLQHRDAELLPRLSSAAAAAR